MLGAIAGDVSGGILDGSGTRAKNISLGFAGSRVTLTVRAIGD